jgi:hypothetical protein
MDVHVVPQLDSTKFVPEDATNLPSNVPRDNSDYSLDTGQAPRLSQSSLNSVNSQLMSTRKTSQNHAEYTWRHEKDLESPLSIVPKNFNSKNTLSADKIACQRVETLQDNLEPAPVHSKQNAGINLEDNNGDPKSAAKRLATVDAEISSKESTATIVPQSQLLESAPGVNNNISPIEVPNSLLPLLSCEVTTKPPMKSKLTKSLNAGNSQSTSSLFFEPTW